MDTRIPRRYKTLLALALVAGPMIWLLFTPYGQRRTDLVLLPLLGRPNVELSLAELSSRLKESELRGRLPEADLRCSPAATPFGDRACTARIGVFGRLPAEALAFYFASGELRAVKLTYRRDVHGELLASLSQRLGAGEVSQSGGAVGVARIISWPVADGILLARGDNLTPSEDPALLWLSGAAMEQRLDAAQGRGAKGL